MAWWPFGAKKQEAPKASPPLVPPTMNLHRQYPEDTITPTRFKSILKQADIGYTSELMELLDAAASDYKIASVLRTRKLSVAAAPWEVEAGEDSDTARKAADDAKEFLDGISNFVQMKMDLLDAHYRGFAAGRLTRAMVDGVEQAVAWEPIESRFFAFANGVDPLVVTEDAPQGIPLPPEYLYHTVRDRPGPVVRGGTGRSVAKLWLYKGYFWIDMASFVEKFGQPHVNVTIPANYVEGSAELERAKSAARALIADHIGLVPEGVAIELLETIKQGSTIKDTYLAAIQFCDEAIAMVELGHTLTSGASSVGGLGHGGEADQAAQVKEEIRRFDAASLADCINERLIWPRHARQWGDKVPRPRFCVDVDEPENQLEKAQSLKLRAETIAILQGAGLKVSIEQTREEFDLDEPAGEGDVLVMEAPPAGPNEAPPPGAPPTAP